ncbi:hypothetical protein J9978_00485 [Chromobacterium violaceum]|uniref:hypothetical protein n=1 Tax=Chromobacterium violaceum TaxID=536 RepID=UPI001B3244BC|nr:hypothetical protein [Chromobacterium violaceum]MBP4047976.1 hypothetical protein [Chromobacterium violaceum]
MSAIFRMLVLGALLASPLALAANYTDPVNKVRFTLPPGWKVRASVVDRVRVLKVIPPKADQRERAAISVQIGLRKPGRSDTLPKLAATFRQEDGDREAANFVRVNQKAGRLVTEYRDGRFVSNRLWIVRHNLHVIQLLDKNRLLEARCTANASEFKTYRRQMEAICLSAQWSRR